MNNPVYLVRAEVAPARYADVVLPTDSRHALLTGYIPFEPLPLNGCAQLETESETTGYRRYRTTVRMALLGDLPRWNGPQVFRLTDVSGRQYLIGLSVPPHVRRELHEDRPARPSDRALCELTLHWECLYGPLEVEPYTE